MVILGWAFVRARRNAKSAAWIGRFQVIRLLIEATGCAPRLPASPAGASNEISPSWP